MIGVVGRVPSSTSPMQEPDAILRTAVPFVSGSNYPPTPGGAGTFTGHTGAHGQSDHTDEHHNHPI